MAIIDRIMEGQILIFLYLFYIVFMFYCNIYFKSLAKELKCSKKVFCFLYMLRAYRQVNL
jgi:hypothetical protein